MAALLDHADSDGLLRDHAQQWVAVSRRRCTSRADLETASRRHPMARVRLGATSFELDDKSLCGGDAASSTPRGGGVATRNSV